MKRRMRAIWLGLVAVVVLALATAFMIDWSSLAGDRITRSISRALERTVTIAGPIRLSPGFSGLKGRATGIVIGSPDWARADEFASIDAAEITFSWLPLLVGILEPERVEIRGVLFELESRPAGNGYEATWHIGPLKPERASRDGGAFHFPRVPRIVLEDAALAVTDAYGQLHDIAVQRFLLRRKGRGALVSAVLGDTNSPVKVGWSVKSLKALGTEASEMVLTVESDAGMMTASGTLGFHPDAGFDLRAEWDLASLGRFGANFGLTTLPQDVPLKATIRIAGRSDAFAVQLDKVESGRSRVHGVLQGRFARQGGVAGAAYNLLELTGELASQYLDPTPMIEGLTVEGAPFAEGRVSGASLVDFLFGPGLMVKLDIELSAVELSFRDTVLKNASTRIMSDARLIRLSGMSGRLGDGSLTVDLVMDRTGPMAQDVGILFSGQDLDLGWLFDGLGMEPLLVAPTDFAGELRAGGANFQEMLATLTGAVHFVSGHGALRGAAARGLALSGVKLPRLDGAEAFPLECLAGRVDFEDGVGVVDGFMMRGAGYEVTGQGYADLGRQMINMRFSPVPEQDRARPDVAQAVAYKVTGPVSGLRVTAVAPETAGAETDSARPKPEPRKLPPLRGAVTRNNPCLAGIQAARTAAAQGSSQ